MKKILWIPQLATVDKKTEKIIINADSNITIMNGIIDNLIYDYKFDILMPCPNYCNCNYSKAINSFNKVNFLTLAHKQLSAFSLRYEFNFHEMMDNIEESQPDFIVNNTPSLTRNIKAVLYTLRSKLQVQPKLINFLHFLDYPGENKVPTEISYFLRQVEGILCSDLAVFQSYTVRDKTIFAINEYFPKVKDIINKDYRHTVWNATYSQTDIDKYKETPKFSESLLPKTIMFPNRLSSTNYSNHLRFFEAIQNISKTRNDFRVIVNNPTQYMTYEEISKLCPNLKVLNDGNLLSREQYLKTLHQVDIGVALFVQEGHGGVSSKEFQAAGCLPVFPKINEYEHLMPEDYNGFCNPDLHDLEIALNYALDICRTEKGIELVKIGKKLIFERDSFEFNIETVKNDLESL